MPSAGAEHTTCFIVAYDIPDDRRRTKIHKVLSGYGTWTQFSLFECFLTRRQYVELKAKMARHLNPKTDSVRFYPLCGNCLQRVETVGGDPPEDAIAYIV